MLSFTVVLLLSLALNVITIWYIIKLLKKYVPISEDLIDLFEKLEEYHFHVKTVSEMQSFYGDEILLNLLRHSKTVVHEVGEFKKAYSLLDEPDEVLELEEGEEVDDDPENKDDAREA
jgi:hypothetical protein